MVLKTEHKGIETAIRAISTALIVVMLGISVFVYKASVPKLLIWLGYILVYVQLPGYFIMEIMKIKPGHISSRLLVSFFSGWSLIVLEYYLSEMIGSNLILMIAGPIMSVAYFATKANAGELTALTKLKPSDISAYVYVFVALALLYTLLRTQYLYIAPEYQDGIYLSIDSVYHMGIMDSLADGYPVQNPWINDRNIYYHFFTEILCCVPLKFWNLNADFITASCLPLMTVYTVTLSIYASLREFLRDNKKAGFYAFTFILSYMFIADKKGRAWGFELIFCNYNFAGYALAGIIACTIVLKYCMTENLTLSEKCRGFILLTLCVTCLAGIKGPIGLIFVGAMIGTLILGIILRRVKLTMTIPVGAVTAAFYIVYTRVISSPDSGGSGTGESIIRLGAIATKCYWRKPLIEYLSGMHVPHVAILLCILAVFLMFFLTAYLLPCGFGFLRELWFVLFKKKEYDFARITVYAAFFLGMAFLLLTRFSGRSQVYFGFAAMAWAPLITGWFFEDASGDSGKFGKAIYGISKVYFVITLIIFAVLMTIGNVDAGERAVRVYNGEERAGSIYKSITNGEYDAMKWLEQNTPEDSLVAVDRYYSVPLKKYNPGSRWHNTFFLYAAYSERNMYFEGAGFSMDEDETSLRQERIDTNNRLFDINNESRGELARELGIDYVVVSKNYNDCGDLSNADYRLCYSNDDVDIYKVKR